MELLDFHPYFKDYLDQFIDFTIKEDVGSGDHTSQAIFNTDLHGKAQLIAKDEGVVAGLQLAPLIYQKINPSIHISTHHEDGSLVKEGDPVLTVEGPYQSILTGERLTLNFIQHLSGIATKTWHLTELVKPLNTKLLDTRKTTPGLRLLEKWAVRAGGGANHRLGLDDMVMIKDNHIDHVGSIDQAIHCVRDYLNSQELQDMPIVVEARNLEEIRKVLNYSNIARILLDNFSPKDLEEAVKLVNQQIPTEASGGIDADNLKTYAQTGVDYISTSELTRNFKPLDLNLKHI